MAQLFQNIKVNNKFYNTVNDNFNLPSLSGGGTLAETTMTHRIDFKQSVRTSGATDLSMSITGYVYNSTGGPSGRGQVTGSGTTITNGGVSLVVGDRLLVFNNTNADENGIYIVTQLSPSTIVDRATDFDSDDNVKCGCFMYMEESGRAKQLWRLTTPNPIILGGVSGTDLTFETFTNPFGLPTNVSEDIQVVDSAVSLTTTSTSFIDVTGATLTTSNTSDQKYNMIFRAHVSSIANATRIEVRFVEDGSGVGSTEHKVYRIDSVAANQSSDSRKTCSICVCRQVNDFGNGLILKVQWRVDNPTSNQNGEIRGWSFGIFSNGTS